MNDQPISAKEILDEHTRLSQELDAAAESRVFDAIGLRLFVGQEVAYAGSDYRGKPTINNGTVMELKPGKAKIYRMARSSTAKPYDWQEPRRHVWVNVERIIGIDVYWGDDK